MIEAYNRGTINVEELFRRLMELAKSLKEEEQRTVAENLSEEELAVFDLLTKPEMDLTKKERAQVKKTARDLLDTLKREKLILDWRKKQQSRAAVRLAIEEALDTLLPERYTQDQYDQKCSAIYQHVFESYYGENRSIYSVAA